ncbi:MAG TPA: glycosyl hydrolase 108 family protein [Ktedonobacteraceae bacterium]|jgi:lysozyme family protein|nr:glycosyl hydrolase 108 family protein [Ktedonobacteraceae bacterium]
MATFDEALTFVLRNEDPHLSGIVTEDSGGRTRFGIAERFHPELGDDFYAAPLQIALQKARDIYRSDYWAAIRGDEIDDQSVATKLLDMAVNMGVRQAVVLCQRAVNASDRMHLVEDGVVGQRTLNAISQCEPEELLQHLREACAAFYQHLAAVRPEAQMYLHGWLARARA